MHIVILKTFVQEWACITPPPPSYLKRRDVPPLKIRGGKEGL